MRVPPARRHPLVAAIRLSLDADRRSTLLTFLTFGLRPTVPIAIAYLVKVVVDSASSDPGTAVAAAAAGIALAAGLSAGSVAYPIELNTRMIEATATAVDQRLMALTSRLPGVTHLERPELLDKLEILRQERVHLSEGGDAFALVLGAGVRAVATAAVLAMLNPLMLLTPLLAIPSLLASRRGQRRRAAATAASAAPARLARHLFSVAVDQSAAAELRLGGGLPAVRARYAAAASEADEPIMAAVTGNLVASALGGLVFAAGYLATLLLILRDFEGGRASLGDVVLTVGLVTMINLQVAQAVAFLGFLGQTVSASAELLWLEDYVAEACRAHPGTEEPPARLVSGIRLVGVGFCYPGRQNWALRDVHLDIPAGSVVAVVGMNGAGKSTLIKLLAGLYEPSAGQILVDGVDLAQMRTGSWYQRASACFQDFSKLELLAGEVVGVGDLERLEDQVAVCAAIQEGAASEVVAALPYGLRTPLGRSFEDGVELSGGQWQRMALARARMRPAPCLLVLDEPTAAIDPVAEDALLSRYIAAARRTAEESRGVTLFASHRLSTARSAAIIVVIEDGSVLEVGSHQALMAKPEGEYRRLYERQARGYS